MRIAVFGEDLFTATIIETLIVNGLGVELVISPLYDRDSNYKSIEKVTGKFSVEFVRVLDINSSLVLNKLEDSGIELIISVHLRKILFRSIFGSVKYGAINVHPSILPKYRGLMPQQHAMIHGESESGVTIHYIDEGVDTGDIIVQETFSIEPDEYISEFQIKILSIYKVLVPAALKLIAEPGFTPTKQDNSSERYYGILRDKDKQIDIRRSKSVAYNQIRALSMPYSGAICLGYRIWTASSPDKLTEAEFMESYKENGIYILEEKGEIVMRFFDGVLLSNDFETVN